MSSSCIGVNTILNWSLVRHLLIGSTNSNEYMYSRCNKKQSLFKLFLYTGSKTCICKQRFIDAFDRVEASRARDDVLLVHPIKQRVTKQHMTLSSLTFTPIDLFSIWTKLFIFYPTQDSKNQKNWFPKGKGEKDVTFERSAKSGVTEEYIQGRLWMFKISKQ